MTALHRSPLLRWLAVALLVGAVFLTAVGWIGVPTPFEPLARATSIGRNYNRYLNRGPDIMVIAQAEDVAQLEDFLRIVPVPELGASPIIKALQGLDYQHSFALLVIQGFGGGKSHVTVQSITRQWDRVIVHAEFVTPRPGEGTTGNLTDAYDLIAIDKAGLLGRDLRFELWDGWRKLKDVVARVGEIQPQSRPTPLPAPDSSMTIQPSYVYPTPIQPTSVPPRPYPAPEASAYPVPATPTAQA
jgi:hypothetical protein